MSTKVYISSTLRLSLERRAVRPVGFRGRRKSQLTQVACVGAHGCAPYKPLIKQGLWAHSRAPLQALIKIKSGVATPSLAHGSVRHQLPLPFGKSTIYPKSGGSVGEEHGRENNHTHSSLAGAFSDPLEPMHVQCSRPSGTRENIAQRQNRDGRPGFFHCPGSGH